MIEAVAAAESLTELVKAFRLGSQISRQILNRDLFNERLTVLVTAHLGDHDRQALIQIQREGSQGLLAARLRAADAARNHFETGERLLAALPMNHEAQLCAESFFCAQKAYFAYTENRYQDSTALIRRAFENDMILEMRYGLEILLMHRVQLVNNLMRIEARRGNWREALVLGGLLLQYLEDPEDRAVRKLPKPWNQEWRGDLESIPAELLGAMHAQIAGEEVQIFRRVQSALRTVDDIAGIFDCSSPARTQIGRWRDFQIIRVDPGRGDFVSAASALLRNGCVPSEPLWRSVATDVISLLRPGLCSLATAR
jgi:hypothetical protein